MERKTKGVRRGKGGRDGAGQVNKRVERGWARGGLKEKLEGRKDEEVKSKRRRGRTRKVREGDV